MTVLIWSALFPGGGNPLCCTDDHSRASIPFLWLTPLRNSGFLCASWNEQREQSEEKGRVVSQSRPFGGVLSVHVSMNVPIFSKSIGTLDTFFERRFWAKALRGKLYCSEVALSWLRGHKVSMELKLILFIFLINVPIVHESLVHVISKGKIFVTFLQNSSASEMTFFLGWHHQTLLYLNPDHDRSVPNG